jgi:aspartate aminotransferase
MSAIRISQRASAITDSITLAISARAKAMQAAGIDVVSLGAGEPDFGTPANIAEAGIQAIRDGHTRYTAAAGMPEVRQAAARWFRRHFDLPFEAENVMVTAGAKPALMLALSAMVDRGDRVLLPAPFWPSYTDIVRLADGEPVVLEGVPRQGFVHSGEQIARAARAHGCRGVVVNYPNNPSGAVPTRAQIEDIVDAAIDADLWILSDEIYARLIYDGLEHVSPGSIERARDRVVVVNGGTKSHSMTGWRVGFLGGPAPLVAAAARIQSQAMGNTCSISQRAVIAVCEELEDEGFERRMRAFDERRHYLHGAINAVEGLRLELPKGAFYALVDCRDLCARLGCDDIELSERLLVDGLVATVPGTPFAMPGFVRLSYAASLPDLQKAVERIRAFVGVLP